MNKGLIIRTNHPEEINEGTIISTTTSELEYDSYTGSFQTNCLATIEVEVEWVGEDYSEYVPEKACNGGCYGYDYWKVVRVVRVETKDVETVPEARIDKDYHVEDILYEIPVEDE